MEGKRFGRHGGQYVPETLMNALKELETAYDGAMADPAFRAELDRLYRDYAGRPSMLYFAENMTRDLGGAKIYLKREDLNHTGSHKINNVLGQVCCLPSGWGVPRHCGRRGRSARRGDGDGRRAVRHGLHRSHGRRGCGARRSMYSACACWAPRWCPCLPDRHVKDAAVNDA